MDLIAKQRELQESSYKLLQERIKELSSEEKGTNVKDFAKAKNTKKFIIDLQNKIQKFKLEYSQEVIGKIIRDNEEYFCNLLECSYKNIDDFLSKPITEYLLKEKNFNEILHIILDSKPKLKKIEKFDKKLKNFIKELKEYINISNSYYSSLSENKSKQIFKDVPQRVAFALINLDTQTISIAIMSVVYSLFIKDDSSIDNTSNTRQNIASEIGEELHKYIAYKYIVNIYYDKSKQMIKAYQNNDFKEFEYINKPLWSEFIEKEIGAYLINFIIDANIIQEYDKPQDDSNFRYLKITSNFLKNMNKKDKEIAYSASITYKPMVIEPLDWQGMYGGGFLQDVENNISYINDKFNLSLIKANTSKDRIALKNKTIPKDILDAINHIQKTPYKINSKILKILEEYSKNIQNLRKKNRVDFAYYRILKETLSLENFEQKSLDDLEKHFKNVEFIKLRDNELTKADKKRIKKAHKEINANLDNLEQFKYDSLIYYEISKYKQGFDTVINIAKDMQKFEKIYFVWRMDFRGRIYPQQTLLNPQAGDIIKSLLLFSEGQKLNVNGKKWFLIHGANCYGEVDKEPLEYRIRWVEENSDKILESVKNYKSDTFWKKAGDPFKFLAWAFEYKGFIENPDNFISYTPVAIDGSNNGFQHITALLKDINGAKKVNVLPDFDENGNLKVADFYAEVANKLKELLEKEYKKFEENKDDFILENTLYYSKEEQNEIVTDYYFNKVADFLKDFDETSLKSGQHFSTIIEQQIEDIDFNTKLTKKDLSTIALKVEEIEKKIRNKELEDISDIEEVKYSLIDELEKLYKRADRSLDKNKYLMKNNKPYKVKNVLKLEPSSFYKILLDKNIINRKFVKKPVMTESYGSSTLGKKEFVLEQLEETKLISNLNEKNRNVLALSITQLLEDALNEVSSSPQEFKKYMKKYAKQITKQNRAIKWVTPLGLEVEQVEYKAKNIKISIGDYKKITFKQFTDEIDKKEHAKGFAPNYIHSLDATHLFMVINKIAKKGINSILTVHDSFATYANDVETLSQILRETFIELHSQNILKDLEEYLKKEYQIESITIPYANQDSFDISKIKDSIYFFA